MPAPRGDKAEKLTEKQEAFARSYFEQGNAAEAYRQAYDVSPNARDSWLYVEACQLLDNPKVALRLQELREQAERLSIFTREKALEELEEARALAFREANPAAAVSATNSKVKLCGYDKPTRIEHTGKDGAAMQFEDVTKRDADAFTSAVAGLAAGSGAASSSGDTDTGGEG